MSREEIDISKSRVYWYVSFGDTLFGVVFRHDNLLKYSMVGTQTKGQFHLIYGTEGTQALFTGLATQIVYGGCDHGTANANLEP
ncbi:MAG: hypothetical protein ABI947_20905 [Chloroflexota bacterium]